MTIFQTFKDFLKTGSTEDLYEKCGPFLEQSKGLPLYRGFGFKVGAALKGAREVQIRQDRQPRDSSLMVHNLMDAYFEKRFGHKVRSAGLFTTGDDDIAKKYGALYYVLPVGDFKFIWGKYDGDAVSDTLYFARQIERLASVSPRAEQENITKEIMDEVTWYTDNLPEAINSGAEIAIMAKSAIIIPASSIAYSEIIKR